MTTARTLLLSGLAAAGLVSLTGCGDLGGGGGASDQAGLLLAKSLSTRKDVNEGAFLLMRPGGPEGTWTRELVVDDDSDGSTSLVMHKALWFEPVVGEPGVLTCSADEAKLSIWRDDGGSWTEEVLWTGELGDKNDRLRDMEVGDVTGDGVDDICLVTHDYGKVFIVEQVDGGYVANWVDEGTAPERTFVHEMELGDVDGDGVVEMFTTPSEPNTTSGEEQEGDIVMYEKDGDGWKRTVVEHFTTRHVKEVLCYDLDQDGTPELYASLEGENITLGAGGGGEGDSTFIKRYVWRDGEPVAEDMTDLPGHLCRFLNGGDTDGDGQHEIVASTHKNGIFKIVPDGDGWKRRPILIASRSGGFEHATILHDWDGDGADDLFVGSDDQKLLQRVAWDAQKNRYERTVLFDFAPEKGQRYEYFIWNMTVLPAGK